MDNLQEVQKMKRDIKNIQESMMKIQIGTQANAT